MHALGYTNPPQGSLRGILLILLFNSTSFITERSWKKGSHFLESAAKQKLFQEKKFYQKALLSREQAAYEEDEDYEE